MCCFVQNDFNGYYLRLGGNGSGGSNSQSITLSTANLPSHSHGLNNHTHSIPSLSGSTSNNGSHVHTMQYRQAVNCDSDHNRWYLCPSADKTTSDYMGWAGDHTHSVTTNASTTGGNNNNTTATGSGSTFSVTTQPKCTLSPTNIRPFLFFPNNTMGKIEQFFPMEVKLSI